MAQLAVKNTTALDLNGTWEYSKIHNLDNFLKDMKIKWAKRKLAKSIASVITCSFTVVQDGNNFRQTIKTPIFTQTREYSVGDGQTYKYKASKGSEMESKYEWNEDKTVFRGTSKNLTRNVEYSYTMHMEKDSKTSKERLVVTTSGYTKNGIEMKIYLVKK